MDKTKKNAELERLFAEARLIEPKLHLTAEEIDEISEVMFQ